MAWKIVLVCTVDPLKTKKNEIVISHDSLLAKINNIFCWEIKIFQRHNIFFLIRQVMEDGKLWCPIRDEFTDSPCALECVILLRKYCHVNLSLGNFIELDAYQGNILL